MSTPTARTILDFALLQSAAETYLHKFDLTDTDEIMECLKIGVNDLDKLGLSEDEAVLPGATRFTPTQAEWFTDNYEIVTHYPNDASGFSCTLFRNKTTGEYTLSFRSTEYQMQEDGGDWEHDGASGADGAIKDYGFSLAQLSSMEAFYEHLKEGEVRTASGDWEEGDALVQAFKTAIANENQQLNVTGYSMGAHLAMAFTLIHDEEVQDTWTYDAAGLGGIKNEAGVGCAPGAKDISDMISSYHARMGDTPVSGNIYEDGNYKETMEDICKNTINNLEIGLEQTLDKILEFNPDDPNSFRSSLYEEASWSKIHQYYGHGEFFDMEFVANSGWHVKPQSVYVEDQPLSRGLGFLELLSDEARVLGGEYAASHSITPLVDSLIVLDLLQQIDKNADFSTLSSLCKAIVNSAHPYSETVPGAIAETIANLALSSKSTVAGMLFDTLENNTVYDADALENLVNALSRVFLGTDPNLEPDTTGNSVLVSYRNLAERELLHQAIARISEAIAGKTLQLVDLTALSGDWIASIALREDIIGTACRYALLNLEPFAVIGADYTMHNAQQELDLASQGGQLTGQWLADRADFLALKMGFDQGGKDDNDYAFKVLSRGDKPYSEAWDLNSATGDWQYVDLSQKDATGNPLTLKVDGNGWGEDYQMVVFGDDGNNTLTGKGQSDRLYGGAGDDKLYGLGGANYLEGGAGADEYHVVSDGKVDAILDVDGRGIVELDGEILQGGKGTAPDLWKSADGAITYQLVNGTTLEVIKDDAVQIRILDFVSGHLNINLETTGLNHATPQTLSPSGYDYVLLSNDARSVDTGSLPDSVTGTGYDDLIKLGDGNDNAQTSYGRDIVYGQEGNDYILAGPHTGDASMDDQDILIGGEGRDILLGGLDDDILHAGNANDHLLPTTTESAGFGDWADGGEGMDKDIRRPVERLPARRGGGGCHLRRGGQRCDPGGWRNPAGNAHESTPGQQFHLFLAGKGNDGGGKDDALHGGCMGVDLPQ